MKRQMQMNRRWIIGLVIGWLETTCAMAGVLSYSVVANNDGANYVSGASGIFELPQFNSDLGTLQQVVLTVTGYAHDGSLTVDNEWSAAGKVQLQLGAYIMVTTPTSAELNFMPSWSSSLMSVAADEDDAADFSGGDSATLTGSLAMDAQNDTPANLMAYIGSGVMTYSFLGEGFSMVLPLSPLDGDGRLAESIGMPTFSLTAEITYEYKEKGGGGESGIVPEPGTLGMGMALVGLSWLKWGRRRFAQRRRDGTGG